MATCPLTAFPAFLPLPRMASSGVCTHLPTPSLLGHIFEPLPDPSIHKVAAFSTGFDWSVFHTIYLRMCVTTHLSHLLHCLVVISYSWIPGWALHNNTFLTGNGASCFEFWEGSKSVQFRQKWILVINIYWKKHIFTMILIFGYYSWENNGRGLTQDHMRTCAKCPALLLMILFLLSQVCHFFEWPEASYFYSLSFLFCNLKPLNWMVLRSPLFPHF